METIPRRVSLVAQTKEVLIEGIANRRWRNRLPGQRRLSRELHVSCGTLRAALAGLARQKLVRIHHGRPSAILNSTRRRGGRLQPLRLGYIWSEPILKLRPFVAHMLDEIRASLQKMGGEMNIFTDPKCYRTDCSRALAELVDQNPHDCWLLAFSTPAMQRWFEKKRLPVIVGGSLHAGVSLPSINIDYRAIGRHAGGAMLSRGHRRVALLSSQHGIAGGHPGGLELAQGLREAFAVSPTAGGEPIVIHHDGKPGGIGQVLDRLRNHPEGPTGLLIGDSTTMLTAFTHLAQREVVIPRDMSLIVAEGEPYYENIVPEISHYEWRMDEFVRQWRRLLECAQDGTLSSRHRIRIVPKFIPGGTLTEPAH